MKVKLSTCVCACVCLSVCLRERDRQTVRQRQRDRQADRERDRGRDRERNRASTLCNILPDVRFQSVDKGRGELRKLSLAVHAVCRVLWCLLVLSMAAALTFTGVNLYLRYRSYPYTTAFSINRMPTISLPAITICLQSSIDASRLELLPNSKLLKEYLFSISFYEFLFQSNRTSAHLNATFGNLSYEDILQVASFSPSDIIRYATLGRRIVNISKEFKIADVFNNRCFSFNSALHSDSPAEYRPEEISPLERFSLHLNVNGSRLLPTSIVDGMTVSVCAQGLMTFTAVRKKDIYNNLSFVSRVFTLCATGGRGFFLACEDFGRMFDNSFPACTFFLGGGGVEISPCTLIPLFRPG